MKNLSILGFDIQVSGYQIDSRSVRAGDLFFAITGNKSDGHTFLKEVAGKGAFGAVVSRGYKGPDYGLKLLRVDDVGDTLREFARVSLKQNPVPVIAITGSVGKTTTKDFIATLLEAKFRVGKTEESQNSKLTLPLTILNRPSDSEVLVLEMGMSQRGDLKRLVSIAPPTIAVLTIVALVHAASFPGGLAEIAKEKEEIFSHPETKIKISNQRKEHIPFSSKDVEDFPNIPFEEDHFLHNLAAAVCVAKKMGLSKEEIFSQLPKLTPPKMRFERALKRGVLFINDAYNAGPESMKAALKSVQKIKAKGKKIAVLGAMKELGLFCKESHSQVGLYAGEIVDHLLAFGDEAEVLFNAFLESKKPAEFFLCPKALKERLKEIINEGDVVLVKGSRALEMERIIE